MWWGRSPAAARRDSAGRGSRYGPRVSVALLILVFAVLPLGPAALEVGSGLALAGALAGGSWRTPTWGPILALSVALLLSAAAHGGGDHWLAALRTPWAWSLAVAVPLLSRRGGARWAEQVGLGVAGLVALWGLAELVWLLSVQAPLDDGGARGPFSHHLTLGYALVPPAAWAAWRRRWGLAALLAGGALSSVSWGPLVSLGVVAVGVTVGPLAGLGAGVAVTLGAVGLLASVDPDGMLFARGILWTSSAELATAHPLGVGPAGYRAAAEIAQDALEPGFHFPLHAHDSALQLAAVAGLPAWLAAAWLGTTLWRLASPPGRVALAAVVVGGLTQDTVGDLEVVRAVAAWSLLPLGNPPRPRVSGAGAGPAAHTPHRRTS